MASTSDTPSNPNNDGSPLDRLQTDVLESQIVAVLQTCYDPEIPVNIYELGLIYEVNVERDGSVQIVMTLTSPQCPVAETLPVEVRTRVSEIQGVNDVKVDVVWDPPWTPEKISEAAKLQLGLV